MLNFCDFIQVYVFTTNLHLKRTVFTTKSTEDLKSKINQDQIIIRDKH